MAVLSQLAPRIKRPDFVQRNADNTLSLPIYRDGTLQAVTSGTISVFDDTGINGTPLVDEAAVVVVGGIATHDITAASLPITKALDDTWQERWTLTIAGQVYTFWRDAQLVLRLLYPVISDDDLVSRHTELTQWLTAASRTSYQDYLDDAWDTIQIRLLEDGRRPALIMSSWSLREVHIQLTLERIFRDFSSSAGGARGKYAEMADHYRKAFAVGWSSMTLIYDDGEDDDISDGDQGQAGSPVVFLGGNGRRTG